MAAETDNFIIATFALWAGDFSYCEQLLREFSLSHDAPSLDQSVERPEDFLRATGVLRLRQLWQKRGEFRKLSLDYTGTDIEITDKPIILETTHLRATLWRTGEREFLLQGYLKDLSWQSGLFERAHVHLSGVAEKKDSILPADSAGTQAEGRPYMPLGAAWIVEGNPFIQVELSDLGLLEASGIWTGSHLPESAELITGAFHTLLSTLDIPLAQTSR